MLHMFLPTALIADTCEVCLHAHKKKRKKITMTNLATKIELHMCMHCSNTGTVTAITSSGSVNQVSPFLLLSVVQCCSGESSKNYTQKNYITSPDY